MPLTALAFFVAFGVGCWLAFVRHPIYGLLVYVGTLYFDPTGRWWAPGFLQSVRWELVAAAVTLVAMAIHRKRMHPAPVSQSAAYRGFVVFVVWLGIQSFWALDPSSNEQLLIIWIKFLVVAYMICGCLDSWKHFRYFLFAQVVGCAYIGWVAYTSYRGGRFGGFGSGSIGEANEGALLLLLGAIVGGCLFLISTWRIRAILLLPLGLIADGVVTTISRSGFLEAGIALLTFNLLAPKKLRRRVLILSVVGVAGFVSLTTSSYWNRIDTIKYLGAHVQGVDDGHRRLVIIEAQLKMFEVHPFGCGAMCTSVLSPEYLPPQDLSNGQRASHNTFMTMLVDHGIPGAVLYLLLLAWVISTVRKSARYVSDSGGFPAAALPALAAGMAAMTAGDMFVLYTKLEARVWFVCLLISFVHLCARDASTNLVKDEFAIPEPLTTTAPLQVQGPIAARQIRSS
jgi:putative inorganic carbon (HCO3(-)) transporter